MYFMVNLDYLELQQLRKMNFLEQAMHKET